MNASSSFAVNGRYLTQPTSGVQRYAQGVTAAMNQALVGSGASVPIIAPAAAPDPRLQAMPLITAGPLGGHLWEQLVLPGRWPGPLLNLGNTAPAVKPDQVVCIHDANVFDAPESYRPAFRATYRVLLPLLAKRAARITTVSAYSARQLARHLPLRAADIAVLPNGHEHALAWDPSLARKDCQVAAGTRFVLALGSRAPHKNLQLVSTIAPELAAMNIGVIVAGAGADIFSPEPLTDAYDLTLLGRVTDDDLAYLMDRALCLIFPSWTEGFGLPIIEAMARGCPVIASDRASMSEVCGDAALLAPPDDPRRWVQCIRQLSTSGDLRDELVGRGRERIKMFSWARTAAGYVELMEEPTSALRRPETTVGRMPRVAVAIATRGRPETVTATLTHLLQTQTLKPDAVIVSCVNLEDAGDAAKLPGVRLVTGPGGLPAQRNTALAALSNEADVIVFFDDDFLADPDWLAAAAQTFRDEPEVVGFTGYLYADGILGPGLSFDEALRILTEGTLSPEAPRIEPFSPYGCNMAFRMSAIGNITFDERLVLYGWQEDRDFGAALAKRGGRLIKSPRARGVHMGLKAGRVAGDRLGYSQVVNPIYLLRKGTMTPRQATMQIFRNVAINLARAARPEPFIDRRGRLRGNVLGFADVLRGRLEPERAATIIPSDKSSGPRPLSPSTGTRDDATAS
ncbi:MULTISPECIES: glycosyltransferase [Bradyrhizobium]|uniref:glycosyltransferase n=1 Tax=Bradyrhizobium TaxID=374 RepID=UPI00351162EE